MTAWGSQWQRESQGCPLGMLWGGRSLLARLGSPPPQGGLQGVFSPQTAKKHGQSPSWVICIPTLALSQLAWPWKALNCLVFWWNGTLGMASLSWARNSADQSVVHLPFMPLLGLGIPPPLGQCLPHPPWAACGLAASHVGDDMQAIPILGKASPAGSLG